ncbi:MAG: hypothetical protein U5Q03_04550 [Bacteroidota bacterium]|nr:hypothetical protein [Bacteroidota bacterium]
MQKVFSILLFVVIGITTKAQSDKELFNSAFVELKNMVAGKQPINFKKAVFVVENCYLSEENQYETFCEVIDYYTELCKRLIQTRDLQYSESDKQKVSVYAAVFSLMKDTIPIQKPDGSLAYNLPFEYDFEDIYGSQNWANMFVTKTLINKKRKLSLITISL